MDWGKRDSLIKLVREGKWGWGEYDDQHERWAGCLFSFLLMLYAALSSTPLSLFAHRIAMHTLRYAFIAAGCIARFPLINGVLPPPSARILCHVANRRLLFQRTLNSRSCRTSVCYAGTRPLA